MADQTIAIARAGSTVTLTIKVTWLGSFPFTFEAGTAWAAQLLVERLQHNLGNTMQALRKEQYEQGWRDAKSKKPKQGWFSEWLP